MSSFVIPDFIRPPEPTLEDQLWGLGSNVPFHAFLGMAGVGKTYTLCESHLPKVLMYEDQNIYITSQTSFAIETVLARLKPEDRDRVTCATFHSLAYHWGTKEFAEGGTRLARSKEAHKTQLFQKGIDDEAMRLYEKNAPSNLPLEVKRRRDFLATFDPACPEPIPPWVFEKPIHDSLRFDMTLLRFWASPERKNVDLRENFRIAGYLFVDEAQDLTPLQADLLLWFARRNRLAVRVYGDPNQQINYDYEAPLFAFARQEEVTILEGHPDYKRVPLEIARAAHTFRPNAPPPEAWANLQTRGVIRPYGDRTYPVSQGYSLSLSRSGVARASEACPRQQFAVSPLAAREAGWDPGKKPIFSTIHGAKGWEAPTVTIQPLKPSYMRKLRDGDPVMSRLMFTAMTRAQETLYLPASIYELCMSRLTALARSA